MAPLIVAEGLNKRFLRRSEARPRTLKEALLRPRRTQREEVWALRGVDFVLNPGEGIGVVGANGAGKSTLLRLVGGVGRPNGGRLEVVGRVGALLDLGAGMQPDLTGRENVFLSGVLAGLTRREVARRLDEVVTFAGLERVIDAPLRTYSTGMGMRLAFSVAVHTDPQLLLVDEVLAVGDRAFQARCVERIRSLKAAGCGLLLVSHNPDDVLQVCDRALWLKDGQVAADGAAEAVLEAYRGGGPSEMRRRAGRGGLRITGVRLLDAGGEPCTRVETGAPLTVELTWQSERPILAPILGVSLHRAHDGALVYDGNTTADPGLVPRLQGAGRACLALSRLDLAGGEYHVSVGAYAGDWSFTYDYQWRVCDLSLEGPAAGHGALAPPSRWTLEPLASRQAG